MEIRRAAAADIPRLLPLVEAYWRFEGLTPCAPEQLARALERLLGEPALGAGWIALAGEEARGYLLAVYVFSLEHRGLTAEIDEFFVAPGARGDGAGGALLEAAEAEFRRRGCTNVSLQIARGNAAAKRFYRRAGYVERADFELMDKDLPQA